jgi:hypothetical protein
MKLIFDYAQVQMFLLSTYTSVPDILSLMWHLIYFFDVKIFNGLEAINNCPQCYKKNPNTVDYVHL